MIQDFVNGLKMQGFRDEELDARGRELSSRMLRDIEVAMRKTHPILPAGLRGFCVVVLMLAMGRDGEGAGASIARIRELRKGSRHHR